MRPRSIALALALVAPADAQERGPTPFSDPAANEHAVLLGEGTVSTAGFETSGTLAPDGRTLYFTRGAPDFGQFFFTIVESRFANGRWSAPRIAPFSGEHADTSPFLSPDGSRLVFSSNRPVNGVAKSARNDFDLWMVERRGDGWSAPVPLTALNGPGWDMHSSMTRDGTLYFGSIRDNNYNIWRSRLVGGVYQTPEPLPAPVNSAAVEYDPFVDPDGRYLIFGSDRAGGRGGADLYVSFLRDGAWSEPVNLGPSVNTGGREAGGFVARVGGQAYLVFNSESGRNLGSPIRPPGRMTDAQLATILAGADNQVRNFYYINLRTLGIDRLD
jgi:hypothetical protein